MALVGLILSVFLLVIGGSIFYYARKEYSSPGSLQAARKCLACGYEGKMKTWLSSSVVAWIIALIGLLFYVIPGLIFIAAVLGKYMCPKCGKIGKNQLINDAVQPVVNMNEAVSDEKKCPYCAELIKKEAVYCRYCEKDLGTSTI